MHLLLKNGGFQTSYVSPGIPTTIKTMGVNITTIAYLRVLIIEMGSTIIFMVMEAPGLVLPEGSDFQSLFLCVFRVPPDIYPSITNQPESQLMPLTSQQEDIDLCIVWAPRRDVNMYLNSVRVSK